MPWRLTALTPGMMSTHLCKQDGTYARLAASIWRKVYQKSSQNGLSGLGNVQDLKVVKMIIGGKTEGECAAYLEVNCKGQNLEVLGPVDDPLQLMPAGCLAHKDLCHAIYYTNTHWKGYNTPQKMAKHHWNQKICCPASAAVGAAVSALGTSVQASWDNHFAAFGAQDLAKILLDYTEASVARVYDYTDMSLKRYDGISGMTNLFTGLFQKLSDLSGLDAPVVKVEQWPGGGQVFLVWRCPTSGMPLVTDTFVFDQGFKILRQNIVVFAGPGADAPEAHDIADSSDETDKSGVQASWDNHFAAFGGQDVDKILLDYTEASVVRVYDFEEKGLATYKGLRGAKDLFTGLFAQLTDLSGLKAPVVRVEQWPGGGQVFLVWLCPTSGMPQVTDTFIFDENFKILRQNIVSWPAAPAVAAS